MRIASSRHSPIEALNKLRRVAQKRRLNWSMALYLLLAVSSVQAPGQQMQIKKNQLLVLNLGTPEGEMDKYEGVRAYQSLIQQVPFIEVHFIRPVPAKRLRRGRMVFLCEEVGIYTKGSAQKTWTIGKRCKLR